jgi:hypothetical protein
MHIRVRLLPPFGDGKTWEEITLPEGSGLWQLLEQLTETQPQIRSYMRPSLEETFHQLLVIRNDYILKENDLLVPDDRLVITMPLTGG